MTLKVHHATAKRATEAKITLIGLESSYQASHEDGSFEHGDAAKALDIAILHRTLFHEFPGLVLTVEEGHEIVVRGFPPAEGGQRHATEVYRGDAIPILSDLCDAAEDLDIDPEEGYTEALRRGGSVVSDTHKRRYAEAGDPRGCGDWLHRYLDQHCTTPEGKSDAEALTALLIANQVPMTGKWCDYPERENPPRGWPGLYRMSGRRALTRQLAIVGALIQLDGTVIEPPQEFLDAALAANPSVEPEWAE